MLLTRGRHVLVVHIILGLVNNNTTETGGKLGEDERRRGRQEKRVKGERIIIKGWENERGSG